MNPGFKYPCFYSGLGLLVNHLPSGKSQIMRNHPPGGRCSHQPAQPVEHLTQAVIALGSQGHQGQIRSHEAPLFITDITRIGFFVPCLKSTISGLKVHNTL